MNKDTIFSPFSLTCRGRLIEFNRPAVFGILNSTPDSFYDGGRYSSEDEIISRARLLLDEGADVIDVGVVSSRPGAILLPPEEEAQRLSKIVNLLRCNLPQETLISVDTCFSKPAKAAVQAGADIINDISGGQFDEQMFNTVADVQVPYILSHTRGLPSDMQRNTHYDDLMRDLALYFTEKMQQLHLLGVADIILDPGFGFAKTTEQNYLLLNHLDDLTTLFAEPLMAGLSRKSMIYRTLDTTPAQALNGTTALNTIALLRGARMLRVHDPRQAREAITLVEKLNQNS